MALHHLVNRHLFGIEHRLAVTVDLYRTVFVVHHTQARGFAWYQFDGDGVFGDRTRRLVYRCCWPLLYTWKYRSLAWDKSKYDSSPNSRFKVVSDRRCHFVADDFFIRVG